MKMEIQRLGLFLSACKGTRAHGQSPHKSRSRSQKNGWARRFPIFPALCCAFFAGRGRASI